MDASPLFPRYEVPLTGRARFDTDDPWLTEALATSALRCMARRPAASGQAHLGRLRDRQPRRARGLVASGDRFVATAAESRALAQALPDALAVEMEGAALAQVCHDFGRPFAVLRTISHRADDDAHSRLHALHRRGASVYTRVIVHDW
jgi:adenosylhomocysteine nucleosidase